jgi:hypothetical protein
MERRTRGLVGQSGSAAAGRGRRVAAWVAGVALLLLLLAAGGLAWLGAYLRDRGPAKLVAFRPDLPGDLRPGISLSIEGHRMQESGELEPYSFTVTTNSLGFRGGEVTLGPESRVVMTIGDGYAFGTSVDGNNTLCDALNQDLPRRFPGQGLACVNAALPGMNLVDEQQYMEEKGRRLAPELLVVVLSKDDVWEMARPVQVREAMRCMPDSAWCSLRFLFYRRYYQLFATRDRVMRLSDDSPERTYAPLLGQYLEQLDRLVALVRGWGGRVLIVTESFEFESLREGLSAAGIPYLELSPRDAPRSLELAPDGHWAAATHRVAAGLVAAWMEAQATPGRPR